MRQRLIKAETMKEENADDTVSPDDSALQVSERSIVSRNSRMNKMTVQAERECVLPGVECRSHQLAMREERIKLNEE